MGSERAEKNQGWGDGVLKNGLVGLISDVFSVHS